MNRLAVLVALICLLAFRSDAATKVEPALGLVDQFSLIVERIDDASRACGITDDLIQSSIRYPILKAGPKVVPRSDAVFDVAITSQRIMNASICITTYELELVVFAPVTYKGKSFSGDVVLWSAAGFISSPVQTHASRMRTQLEDEAKDFVVNWSQMKNGEYPNPYSAGVPR